MGLPKIKLINIIYVLAILIADIFLYVFLGLLFMGYEDFYDESKGPWMSLQSMTTRDKIVGAYFPSFARADVFSNYRKPKLPHVSRRCGDFF